MKRLNPIPAQEYASKRRKTTTNRENQIKMEANGEYVNSNIQQQFSKVIEEMLGTSLTRTLKRTKFSLPLHKKTAVAPVNFKRSKNKMYTIAKLIPQLAKISNGQLRMRQWQYLVLQKLVYDIPERSV